MQITQWLWSAQSATTNHVADNNNYYEYGFRIESFGRQSSRLLFTVNLFCVHDAIQCKQKMDVNILCVCVHLTNAASSSIPADKIHS